MPQRGGTEQGRRDAEAADIEKVGSAADYRLIDYIKGQYKLSIGFSCGYLINNPQQGALS